MRDKVAHEESDGPITEPTGQHPLNRLTAVRVRNLKTPGRYADGNGLYLVVDPSGAKRWIWRGKIRAKGKGCDLGLGSVQLVTLADARDKAAQLRRDARSGKDPLAERQRERNPVPTFKKAAQDVHTSHAKTFRNPKHRAR